jgi:hypothetical protein
MRPMKRSTSRPVQLGLIAHCELMGDRMALLDPPPSLNVRDVQHWRQGQRLDPGGWRPVAGEGRGARSRARSPTSSSPCSPSGPPPAGRMADETCARSGKRCASTVNSDASQPEILRAPRPDPR